MGSKPHQPGEGCIRHADGLITDADFWDDMLDNPEGERASLLQSRERALAQGMSRAEVDKYLPLDRRSALFEKYGRRNISGG